MNRPARILGILTALGTLSAFLRADEKVGPDPVSASAPVSAMPAAASAPTGQEAEKKKTDPDAPALILVRGADGAPEFGSVLDASLEAWKRVATKAGAETIVLHGQPEGGSDADRLREALTGLSTEGSSPVWLVFMGHGTWDGKEARFNLEGPDVSASQLAEWLKPMNRPLVVINASSCSAPFLNVLAGPGRTIISATRSGSERNYSRFGEYLAKSLEDSAADYDQDGQWSLLEWFLSASSRTQDFYKAEGRIATEHALIDDNGDGKGTPADWFRGLRTVKKSRDEVSPDGARAEQTWLIPDVSTLKLSPEQRSTREGLEGRITSLRALKTSLPEDEYYQKLEELLRALAAVYNG